MSISLTKNNSFRFEDNRTKPICVISSRSKNQHIITADIGNGFTPTLRSDFENKISKTIREHSSEHKKELHYKKKPELSEHHTHFKYPDRNTMLESLKQDFPQEAEIIVNALHSQEAGTSKDKKSLFSFLKKK